jgi:hypothetical protein
MTTHSHLPHSFFDLFNAAHLDQGLAASFLRMNALLDLHLDQYLQIRFNLFLEFLFSLSFTK